MFRSPSPYMPEGQYGGPQQQQYGSRPPTTAPGGYRSTSPMPPSSPYNQTANMGAQTLPGSITYTTSTGPNGQIIYHPFQAVPASYNTDAGTITGIQWVSIGPTPQLPANATPATASFAEQMQRGGQLSGADQKALKDWQKAEEKRRRKEEKEAAKQLRDKDRYSQTREDIDLRAARERDAVTRERRKSINAGANTMAFPGAAGSNASGYGEPQYPGAFPSDAPTYGRERKYSVGGGGNLGGLDRQFGELEIERGGSEYGDRQRKQSGYGGRPTSAYGAPAESSFAEQRERRMSGNYGNAGVVPPARPYSAAGTRAGALPSDGAYSPRGGDPYGGSVSPNPHGIAGPYGVGAASPNHLGHQGYPSSRPVTPNTYGRPLSPNPRPAPGVYPTGHILAGQPMSNDGGLGLQQFPGAGAAPAPLAAPEGFSRPPNAAAPYTYFETLKISDMDDFYDSLPKMPPVLQTHDTYSEDWTRLMQDISRAWSGKLNVPTDNGRPPKRSTLAGQILDIWNDNFFLRRGAELVLYKGRERRSGPKDGHADLPEYLLLNELSSDSSSSETDSDDSDEDRYAPPASGYGGVYGGGYGGHDGDARRHRREAKSEKKRRRKEKRTKRKARAREKKYALYLLPAPQGGAPGGMHAPGGQPHFPGGYGMAAPAGYGPTPSMGGGYATSTPSMGGGYATSTPSMGGGYGPPSAGGYGPTTPSVSGGYGLPGGHY